MGFQQRRKTTRSPEATSGSTQANRGAESKTDTNRARRQQYREDEQFRERVKAQSRSAYRKEHPRQPKRQQEYETAHKEVTSDALERADKPPVFMDVLTLQESANYLNRTILTLRKWIDDELVPPPILRDTSRGYKHYSEPELRIMKKILEEHGKEYDYLSYLHTRTIHDMWQRVEGYRKNRDYGKVN